MLPYLWKQRVQGPAVEPVDGSGFRAPAPPPQPETTTETAPEPPVPFLSPEQRQRRDRLALALHERWHRGDEHMPNGMTVLDCAELSGALDDADVVLTVIDEWAEDAQAAYRRGLLDAAAMAERIARIGSTPQRDAHPADLAWFTAEPQAGLRRAVLNAAYTSEPLHAVAKWLRTLAETRP